MKKRIFIRDLTGIRTVRGLFLLVFTALLALNATGHAANLVPDPSFENGTANWVLGDYASSIDSTVALTGSNSLNLLNDASAANHNAGQYGIGGVQAGTEYTYSVWVKGNNVQGIGAGGKPLAVVRWKNSSNAKIEKEMYMWAPYGTYNWTQLKINLQAPPNADKVDVSFRSWFDCTTGTSNWDDIVLEPRDLSYRGDPAGTYQAESASSNFGGAIESVETNYTGTGYFETSASNPYIEWNDVDGGAGGTRLLSFRYTQEGMEKFWDVYVNDVKQSTLKPVATGRISSWASTDFEVTLSPGNNTVRVNLLDVGFPFLIDKMDVFLKDTLPTADTPMITPNGGAFSDFVNVSLQTTTPGAIIYYTTDGSTPSTVSSQYTAPFTLTSDATVKAYAVATGYSDSAVASTTFTVTSSGQQPYGGTPWLIPGIIEAENYDVGGEGVAYHDTTAANLGLVYRTDGVDIWYSTNPPEGYYTGASATGEWLEYTVNVATAGQYRFDLRVATPNTGRLVHIEVDGVNVTGSITLPNTGSWSVWQTVSATAVLGAGWHVLRVAIDVGGFNFNRIDITTTGTATVATPTITPNGGAFIGSVEVALQTSTIGATIYYTTDGSTPSTVSSQYTAPFTLTSDATVKAYAVATGYSDSAVASAVFTRTIQPTVATPTITPNGGAFSDFVNVSLQTTTPGAIIYYTTDGSTPSTVSSQYTAPFTLTSDATVKAYAVATGYSDSAVASTTFTVTSSGQQPYGGTPWLIPGIIEAENYDVGGEGVAYHDTTAANLGLVYRTDGVDIWYSTNPPEGYYTGASATGEWLEYTVNVATAGQYRFDLRVATPNTGRLVHIEVDGVNVTGSITLPNTGSWSVWQTVSATAVLGAGWHVLRVAIDVGGFNFNRIDITTTGTATVATPTITPNGGAFIGSVEVALQTSTIGATIYYTTDGSTPSTVSSQYTAPFTLTSDATVKAYAVATGYSDSAVASAVFTRTIQPTVATPTITPNGGAFSDFVNVSLQTTTPGATIYYTTDGSTPSTVSSQYTAPFTLTSDATVKAYAVATGYSDSAVASTTFTVTSSGQQPYGGTPWLIPGIIEAENYDVGGEGVAYHDTTAANLGLVYRTDGVDIWYSTNPPEGYYTGASATGEWLEYTVNVATAGQYRFDLRVATPNTGRLVHIEVDGVNVTGSITLPNTGSWSVWQTVSATAVLGAGWHVLRVAIDVGGFNFNRIDITTTGTATVATPTISPNGGSFSDSVVVSLSTSTQGATIYYTTNGSVPNTGSIRYTAPFTLTTDTTVRAYAVAVGYTDSEVVSAIFIIGNLNISDDFNDGNADGWTVVNNSGYVPSWQVINGQYQQLAFVGFLGTALQGGYHLGTYSSLDAGIGLSNYRFSVTATPLAKSGQEIGVMFYYLNSNNYYRVSFSFSDGFSRLEKKVSGVFKTLSQNARGYPIGTALNISGVIKNGIIQISVNGERLFSAYDTSLSSGTIAMYCRDACAFDNVAIETSGTDAAISIADPTQFSVLPSASFDVSAVALNKPISGTVEFELDGDVNACTLATEVSPGLFKSQCTAPSSGPHLLTATLKSAGSFVDSDAHSFIASGGNYFISIGDSISWGMNDFFSGDGSTQDGTIFELQGFQSNLVDALKESSFAFETNIIFKDTVPGDKAIHVLTDRLPASIERHPFANYAIILIGTNDAGGTTKTAPGEDCSGSACNGTFKGNLKGIISALNTAGKAPIVIQVPPRFGDTSTGIPYSDPLLNPANDLFVSAYNRIIRGEDLNPLSGYAVGPDTFDYFLGGGKNRFTLFYDNLHPGALGHAVLAVQLHNTISPTPTDLPFVLEDICVRYTEGAACSNPTLFKQDLMESGDTLYIDQPYLLTNTIPSVLEGGRWIRTANLDQANSDYLSFAISKSSDVYVAYDSKAASLPVWLQSGNGFVDTGLLISTTNPWALNMKLYKRNYSAGTVVLGGANGVQTGAAANYVVIVK